jgi:hypothetical protein
MIAIVARLSKSLVLSSLDSPSRIESQDFRHHDSESRATVVRRAVTN